MNEAITPSTEPRSEALESHLKRDALNHLFSALPGSLTASVGASLVLAVVLWQLLPPMYVSLWLAYAAIIHLFRWLALLRFRRDKDPGSRISHWQRVYAAGAICGGLSWGIVGSLLMPEQLAYQMLLLLALAGFIAWASRSMMTAPNIYAAFTAATLLPLIVWMLEQGDLIHAAAGSLAVVYGSGMVWIAHINGREFRNIMALRYENQELVADLKEEIRRRTLFEQSLRRQNEALEKVLKGIPLAEVFLYLNLSFERMFPEAKSSILLLHEDGKRLFTASAPSLPEAYCHAIDGGSIGPKAGSCGTAAFRNELVIVEDIAVDPLWQDYKQAALAHDLRACWSMPIRGHAGQVLGTFAVYYAQPRRPSENELEFLTSLARLAGLAIEHERMQHRLEYAAQHDALTGLPNRALFFDRLHHAVAAARRLKQRFAVLFVDLDGFKAINDIFGHDAGDHVLKEIGKRLQGGVRAMDTAARFAGDEFTLILMDVKRKRDAAFVAKKLLQGVQAPIAWQDKQLRLDASIGIAFFPEDAMEPEELLRRADHAMYEAKRAGKGAIRNYSDAK